MEYFCKSSALLGKKFEDLMADRLDISFSHTILFKIFDCLKMTERFNVFNDQLEFITLVLSYIK